MTNKKRKRRKSGDRRETSMSRATEEHTYGNKRIQTEVGDETHTSVAENTNAHGVGNLPDIRMVPVRERSTIELDDGPSNAIPREVGDNETGGRNPLNDCPDAILEAVRNDQEVPLTSGTSMKKSMLNCSDARKSLNLRANTKKISKKT